MAGNVTTARWAKKRHRPAAYGLRFILKTSINGKHHTIKSYSDDDSSNNRTTTDNLGSGRVAIRRSGIVFRAATTGVDAGRSWKRHNPTFRVASGVDRHDPLTPPFHAGRSPRKQGGRRGIRTPGRVTPTPVFKTGALNQTQPSVLNGSRESTRTIFGSMSHPLKCASLDLTRTLAELPNGSKQENRG